MEQIIDVSKELLQEKLGLMLSNHKGFGSLTLDEIFLEIKEECGRGLREPVKVKRKILLLLSLKLDNLFSK